MKIYGNFVGTLETARNREMSALERFDYIAIQLLLIFSLNYLQAQAKRNPLITFSKNFSIFSSHGNLCTTMSQSWLVELMPSVGVVHECLNAFFYISDDLNEAQEDTSLVSQPTGVQQSILLESGLSRSIVSRASHKNVAFCQLYCGRKETMR